MNIQLYQIAHIFAVVMLTAVVFGALAAPHPEHRKRAMMWSGILALGLGLWSSGERRVRFPRMGHRQVGLLAWPRHASEFGVPAAGSSPCVAVTHADRRVSCRGDGRDETVLVSVRHAHAFAREPLDLLAQYSKALVLRLPSKEPDVDLLQDHH